MTKTSLSVHPKKGKILTLPNFSFQHFKNRLISFLKENTSKDRKGMISELLYDFLFVFKH